MNLRDSQIGDKLIWDAEILHEGYKAGQVNISLTKDRIQYRLEVVEVSRPNNFLGVLVKYTDTKRGQWLGWEDEHIRKPTEQELKNWNKGTERNITS